MILSADNAYMKSLGILDDDDSDDDMNMEDLSNSIYAMLPHSIKSQYGIDDIFTVLYMELNYIISTDDADEINEAEMYKYIQQNAADNGIEISIDDIQGILDMELSYLNDYDDENDEDDKGNLN
jgi:hypothetical protein